jgi:hypothetical protein
MRRRNVAIARWRAKSGGAGRAEGATGKAETGRRGTRQSCAGGTARQ